MVCAFEFPELASHNAVLKDLDETGYRVDFIGGYLVIFGLPYLDQNGDLQHGDWASPLDLNGAVIDPPKNHQAWWRGSAPCDQQGRALRLGSRQGKVTINSDLITDYAFSVKLQGDRGQLRCYRSFEEKVQTYIDMITAPAMAVFPKATPLAAIPAKVAAQGSPLKFPDTMSGRYHLNDLSDMLRGKKVAIIGLGGTGSYILDFIARTHLEQICLFDDDKIHVHTIFRIPGFIPNAIGKPKVEMLMQQYSHWHSGIVAVAERITDENVARLKEFDFVFVSVDEGAARHLIVGWLSANDVAFVDCGMGLNRSAIGLAGIVRVTGVDRHAFEDNVGSVRLPVENGKEDEYRTRPQITELNALNAAMAVIRFKQHFKLLDYEGVRTSYLFDTVTFEID